MAHTLRGSKLVNFRKLLSLLEVEYRLVLDCLASETQHVPAQHESNQILMRSHGYFSNPLSTDGFTNALSTEGLDLAIETDHGRIPMEYDDLDVLETRASVTDVDTEICSSFESKGKVRSSSIVFEDEIVSKQVVLPHSEESPNARSQNVEKDLMLEVDLLAPAGEEYLTDRRSCRTQSEEGPSASPSLAGFPARHGSMRASEKQNSLRKKRQSRLFPEWWNPSKLTLENMMMQNAIVEANHESVGAMPSRCVLSPVTFPKLHWDFFGFSLIFYDAWATPFQMIFESDSLELGWMNTVNMLITLFFTVDIFINFNTGLVFKRGVCFERKKIVRRYLKKWFWLDLAATLPYDLFFQLGSVAGFLRFLKILKALKTLRFIRIMRTMKSLQSTENDYFNIIAKSKNLIRGLAILVAVLVDVHICSCVWLALRSEVSNPNTFSKAFDIYSDAFVQIFFAVLNGVPLQGRSGSLKVFEMLMAIQQPLLLALFSAFAIFQALLLYGDAAKSQLMRERALRYMRRRRLPLKTQIEVLSGLTEATGVKTMQKDFDSLSSNDLHEELRRKLSYELWSGNFLTIGILAKVHEWDRDFLHSLSLVCREDILATDCLIFEETDLCIAAYYVISGGVKVTCALIASPVPLFDSGTWLGESALVNPSFRRGLRAASVSLTCLMVVPAVPFQKLLKESNLWELFQTCVRSEVWQGLCGRCGLLGDHFFDSCPFVNIQKWGVRGKTKKTSPIQKGVRRKQTSQSDTDLRLSKSRSQRLSLTTWALNRLGSTILPDEDEDEDRRTDIKELVGYLHEYDTLYLLPYLNELDIYNLTDLEALDISELAMHLSHKNPPVELSDIDRKVLSGKYINSHREFMLKGMDQILDQIESHQHLMFLSHYKIEAGTEAALLRSEIESMLHTIHAVDAEQLRVPIFLDSEDLTDLNELMEHVKHSFNLILLLTDGVLSRPWVLLEIVTAVNSKVPVTLVEVSRPGVQFEFPTEQYYQDLRAGNILDKSAMQLLSTCGVSLDIIEEALRKIFRTIAIPYSPHRPVVVRNAEVERLLRRCHFRGGEPVMVHSGSIAKSAAPRHKKRGSLQSSFEELMASATTTEYITRGT